MEPKSVWQSEVFKLEYDGRILDLIRLSPILPDNTIAPRYIVAGTVTATIEEGEKVRKQLLPIDCQFEASSLTEAFSKAYAALEAHFNENIKKQNTFRSPLLIAGAGKTLPNLRGGGS